MVNTRNNASRIQLRSAMNQEDDTGLGSHHNHPPRQTNNLQHDNSEVVRENPLVSPPTMTFDATTIEVLREMMVQVAQTVIQQATPTMEETNAFPVQRTFEEPRVVQPPTQGNNDNGSGFRNNPFPNHTPLPSTSQTRREEVPTPQAGVTLNAATLETIKMMIVQTV